MAIKMGEGAGSSEVNKHPVINSSVTYQICIL